MQPQFLAGVQGPLFAIYHPPDDGAPRRGHVLYIHPFAEEMNKARRMAALQARLLAAGGFGVLLPDLYGCGDSGGDFGEARWEIWREDLRQLLDGLRQRCGGPAVLWGLRAGALLAAELAQATPAARLILWQPAIDGTLLLNQFLRLRLAAGLLGGAKESTGRLRERLAAGETLEVAGYALAPAMASALAQARLQPPSCRVDWFELVPEPDRPLAPASRRAIDAWQAAGVELGAYTVPGEPFWSTQEIVVVPSLLEATTRCVTA